MTLDSDYDAFMQDEMMEEMMPDYLETQDRAYAAYMDAEAERWFAEHGDEWEDEDDVDDEDFWPQGR